MSEPRAADPAVDDGAQRVHRALRDTVDLCCRSGGGIVFEEFPGALQEPPSSPDAANGTDASRARPASDPAGTGVRELLAAAEGLAETVAQLDATARSIQKLHAA